MGYARLVVAVGSFYCVSLSAADQSSSILNPAIDVQGYLRVAGEAARHRESHRLSEDEFIRMSREPGAIVLDARSKEKYDELHVNGALSLSFPGIAIARLRQGLPAQGARILVNGNDHFR